MKRLIAFALVILISLEVLFVPYSSHAQDGIRLTLNSMESLSFPTVAAYFTVTDSSGLPVKGLDAGSFTLTEDGQIIADFNVTELENSAQPISIVLALDISGSMQKGYPTSAIENTQMAATAFVEGLGPDDQIGLVTFADEATVLVPLTTDKETVTRAIMELEAGGNTALYDSQIDAVGMLKNLPAGRKAIVVLSDGADTSSSFTFDESINELTRWSIPVYPIGFGDVNPDVMEKLATLTGGYVQIQPDSTQVAEAFSIVQQTLRHQYRVDFTSHQDADGRSHTLLIALDITGGQVQDSQGFIATPQEIRVTLNSPNNNAVVSSEVRFAPEFVAPAPIVQVTYYIDGQPLAVVASDPFSYVWDSAGVSDGSHDIRIEATDIVGNTGNANLTLEVRPPILVSWINPTEGIEVTGSQVIEIEVDAPAGVGQIEFYQDENLLGSVTSPPYQIEWSTKDAEPGPHTIRVLVTDSNNVTLEDEVEVTVLLQQGRWIIWLALGIAVVTAGLIIPVAVQRRRKFGTTSLGVEGAGIDDITEIPVAGDRWILKEIRGRQPGSEWEIDDTGVRIGRKAELNDIPADGLSASRQHARVQCEGNQCVLHNLVPENLTYVNGNPIHDRQVLNPGDTVQIGDSEFLLKRHSEPR